MRSFYDIFTVSETASTDDIKIAYHEYLRNNHPDKANNKILSHDEIEIAKRAWHTLRYTVVCVF